MTCRELLAIEFAEDADSLEARMVTDCPYDYGYADVYGDCNRGEFDTDEKKLCSECWDTEADEEAVKRVMKENIVYADSLDGTHVEIDNSPKILDSGDRTEFPSGAVRDMRVGKGRCDLLPLDVVASFLATKPGELDDVLMHLYSYQTHKDERLLYTALSAFARKRGWNDWTMLLEVAKHFEEGAKKYGDNNWQKGIPVHCYIDSAVRHYLKYLRGDQDEPHDRAFCWNILCCIWTVKHIEEGKENV